MYAKVKNGQLVQFPYSQSELQADNPYTNFNGLDVYEAFQGTETNLNGNTLELVVTQEQPQYDSKTQVISLSNTPVVEAGQWMLKWSVRNKTTEEIAQQNVEQAQYVRAERNRKLVMSDWTQVADAPVSQLAWATYRQALRDIPSQQGFPWDVQWPTQPE